MEFTDKFGQASRRETAPEFSPVGLGRLSFEGWQSYLRERQKPRREGQTAPASNTSPKLGIDQNGKQPYRREDDRSVPPRTYWEPSAKDNLTRIFRAEKAPTLCDLEPSWDVAESAVAIGVGAWAARKFGGPLLTPTKSQSYSRLATRWIGVGNSMGSTCSNVILHRAIDRLFWQRDLKMDFTAGSDWIAAPALSLLKVPVQHKVGLMISTHMLGRIIDHFRQPQPHR